MTAVRPSRGARSAQKRRYVDGMDAVEERLRAVAGAYAGPLGDAAASTLAAGGKRVRPLLTLLSARRDAPLADAVIRAAAAVELLHMATLVHDDVLDRAELRRGRPTVAHAFGVETAVSTGNYLLARAFAELAATGSATAVDVLSATAVGLSEGEVLQVTRRSTSLSDGGLPAPLRAQDGRPVRRRLRASAPCSRGSTSASRRRSRSTADSSAWPSRSSTTSSTSAATRRTRASGSGPTCATAR